jgi:glyoxylase-like metal-dependent hydrolase (beta-lactamase superfamily II)
VVGTVIAPRVSCFRDTCNVYVLRSGTEAILVDFGDGDVLDHLDELGVERVTDVLITHHHRDQLGGLRRAVEQGIRIWAPPGEVELIAGMDERWRRRQVVNDYDLREDRFSLLESVPVTGAAAEYRLRRYGAFDVYTLPTPGHTLGSVTYVVEVDGRRLAFTGDLVHGDGKLWSLAATQWTYSGVEGWGATIVSCHALAAREPHVLLPSHGDAVEDPAPALARVSERVQGLIDLRLPWSWNVGERVREPFEQVTPHLLRNRTMFANNYVLLSETGAALLIDFGYDVTTTTAVSSERAARRTLLWSLDGLRRNHGVARIEAAVVTHYHDDHVAGLNLLREIEGAQVWAPANVAPVLEQPSRYDLPCLWFDPIPVDRMLALDQPVRWHEHELTIYPLPGHTRYAAAISVEVDGKRVLVTGDQQAIDGDRAILNFQYRNRFVPEDFVRSAELYKRIRPDVILGGHWLPLEVTPDLLERLLEDARRTVALHEELLPVEGFGTEGFGARIEPYRATGPTIAFRVSVRNPFARAETASVRLVVPAGWTVSPPEHRVELDARGEAEVAFDVLATGPGRVAADLTVGETRFGQQAEALVGPGAA